jgi:hypothetical protein
MNILLITNDADNRRKAEAEGLNAMTMADFRMHHTIFTLASTLK